MKKYILITGGNAGIGRATAVALAKAGNAVVITSRSKVKGQEAVATIRREAGHSEVHFLTCDLANLASVRTMAQQYQSQFGPLDTLINNAGLITDKLQWTQDGFEMQIGVNHLGHFLLTSLLLPLLQNSPEARIINVSSKAHYNGRIRFDSFRGELGPEKYNGMAAYAQSKLANILFTKELARRYPGITSHSLHPGVVGTSIAEKNDNKLLWRWGWKLFSPFMLTPAKGARTSVFLASHPKALESNGQYFDKQRAVTPDPLAKDVTLAMKLWDKSAELTSVRASTS